MHIYIYIGARETHRADSLLDSILLLGMAITLRASRALDLEAYLAGNLLRPRLFVKSATCTLKKQTWPDRRLVVTWSRIPEKKKKVKEKRSRYQSFRFVATLFTLIIKVDSGNFKYKMFARPRWYDNAPLCMVHRTNERYI